MNTKRLLTMILLAVLAPLGGRAADVGQSTLAQAIKETEQSTANKLLGGGSMLTSGIGGMQLMQGMTERSADKDADADMRAYMDTFRCGIGDTGNFNIRDTGTVQVIPGYGAATMALKAEYTNLALDTAAKKNALGIQPGIESELVLDTTHLYSSDAMGLVRENRFDTAADRVASNDAKTRMIAGGAMLGAGVVGGVVGNLLINKNTPSVAEQKQASDFYNEYCREDTPACRKLKSQLEQAKAQTQAGLEI